MKKKKTQSSKTIPDWEAQRPEPTEGELTKLSTLANLLLVGQEQIEHLKGKIQLAMDECDRIQFQAIPELMAQYGLSEFKLKDGSRITVKPVLKASMPSESAIEKCHDLDEKELLRDRLDQCFAYLRSHGAEALIKNLIRVEFGKGKEKEAKQAVAALRKVGVMAQLTPNVHYQTLNAWVRERIEAGKPMDMELFKVFSGNIAIVESPKV